MLRSIMPHPPLIIPDVGGEDRRRVDSTCKAMMTAAQRIAATSPDVVIIVTPHGPVGRDFVPVLADGRMSGDLASFGSNVSLTRAGEEDLGQAIVHLAKERNLPVERVTGYGMDHGTLVPLWYLDQARVKCPIVIIGTGFVELDTVAEVGGVIADAAENSGKRCVLIASGDLSHRLKPEAPLGFEARGKEFDQAVTHAVAGGDIRALIELPPDLVEDAGECGLRPIITVMGARNGYGEVLSYEGEFGVGYLVAVVQTGYSLPVRIARDAIRECSGLGQSCVQIEGELTEPRAVFVSLKKQGKLRGCMGTVEPTTGSAREEIRELARSAAMHDPRFPSVSPDELDDLEVSVDILQPLERVNSLAELDPRVYGVVVVDGQRRGVLLPDLPDVTDVREQVVIACQKAGIDPGSPSRVLYRFRVVRYY